jgi:hypothetical protein
VLEVAKCRPWNVLVQWTFNILDMFFTISILDYCWALLCWVKLHSAESSGTLLSQAVLCWVKQYSAESSSTLLSQAVLWWVKQYSAESSSTLLSQAGLCWVKQYSAESLARVMWVGIFFPSRESLSYSRAKQCGFSPLQKGKNLFCKGIPYMTRANLYSVFPI